MLAVGLLLVALLGGAAACRPSAEAPAPSVLLVVLDTVRADRSSAYGHPRRTTPQLEAVAELGVLFEDVTAPGCWTVPSHGSLFTGVDPWIHGARRVPPGAGVARRGLSVGRLREDLPTLAERFAAAGYRTTLLSANPWLSDELGLTRGFEHVGLFERDRDVVSALVRDLDQADERPRFVFVNLLSAHAPYLAGQGAFAPSRPEWLAPATAPAWLRPYLHDAAPGVRLGNEPEGDGRGGVTRAMEGTLAIPPEGRELLLELYDAGVYAADAFFSMALEEWAARHPESIVAVTSDHGEGFGEHGLWDHHGSVYPEVLRVPLVIAAPDRLPTGVRVRAPVSLTDLHATLLELAGLGASPGSLLRHLDGAPGAPSRVAAAAFEDARLSRAVGGRFATSWRLLREGPWALVRGDDGSAELYRLDRDPGMRRDLAAQEPERLRALAAAAEAHFAGEVEPRPAALDAAVVERLRALGYAAPDGPRAAAGED